jgi:C4-dicarboxylate-specific signal transduction histidine kinase
MSFRLKTILGIAVIEALLLSFMIFKGVIAWHSAQLEDTQKSVTLVAELYLEALKASVLTNDVATVESVTREIAKRSDLAFAQVDGPSGTLFEKTYTSEYSPSDSINSGRFILVQLPIRVSGTSYGQVSMAFDTSRVESGYQSVLLQVIAMGLFGMILSFLLSYALGRYLVSSFDLLIDGTKKVAAGNYSHRIPIKGSDEIAALGTTFNDMTASLENNEIRIAAQQVALIESARLSTIGEMAAGIAHEVNNPLSIIAGSVHMITEDLQAGNLDSQTAEQSLKRINNMIRRISTIVKGLRRISRNGEESEPFATYSLNEILAETISLSENKFKETGVKLHYLPPTGEINLECQSVSLSQVILNLLSNAIDAVQNSIDPWVELDIADQGIRLKIQVTDSGSGISPELEQKIMKPFFTTKVVGKGTGLGLSIVQRIIEELGGKIYIDHECKNTRFVIDLPKTRA